MAVRAHITHGMSAHKKGGGQLKADRPFSQVCAPRFLCSRAYCRYFARVRSAYAAEIAEQYPNCDVDCLLGGQPLYYYLISVE